MAKANDHTSVWVTADQPLKHSHLENIEQETQTGILPSSNDNPKATSSYNHLPTYPKYTCLQLTSK